MLDALIDMSKKQTEKVFVSLTSASTKRNSAPVQIRQLVVHVRLDKNRKTETYCIKEVRPCIAGSLVDL